MTPETVRAEFPEMTEEDYQKVVSRWVEINDIQESDKFYEEQVFPRSCFRMREQAPEVPADLLLVPVGTQSYAPLLCCLGNPAKKTVLLMTAESRKFAEEVEELLGGERDFLRVLISANDPGDIVGKVMSVFDVTGQPKDVVCDVTGGTKIMTASLAGIAATNGWRQVYVQSEFVRNKGSHSERVIPVSSVFDHLGGWNAAHAWKMASVGQFQEATRLLKLAVDESLASAQMKRDIRRFALAQAYREANISRVCREAPTVAKVHGVTFTPQTLELLRHDNDREGFHFWVAHTLASEEQKLAACGALTALGISSTPAEIKRDLGRLRREYRRAWRLDDWKPLDVFLGYPYSQEAAHRG